MIQNKADYIRFLRGEQHTKGPLNFVILYLRSSFKPTQRFLLLLRTCEYLKNVKTGFIYFILYAIVKYLKYRLSTKLGFSIPENVADEGLQLPHYGTIVINPNARLGKHCRIHVCVNIGASGGSSKAPKIGDYVYFAPGAKVYGDIVIADRIAIAANSAVATSFKRPDKLVGGVPAKELGNVDISKLIKKSIII